jgi:Transmembrane secretion effector
MMSSLTKNSTWTALRNPVFRNFWLASLLSGTCVAAHDTAATWLMNRLTASPLLISLVSTVAALPFFFLTLPAGAVADVVDRKKLLSVINLWLAMSAAVLAILGLSHLLTPERSIVRSEYFRYNEMPTNLQRLREHRAYLTQIITHRMGVDQIQQAFESFSFGCETGKVIIEQ